VKVLCLVIVNVTKHMPQKCQIKYDRLILWLSGVFFQALNTPKLVFGRGSALDPAGGAYDAAPDSQVGWGGDTDTPPHTLPHRHLRRLARQASNTNCWLYAYEKGRLSDKTPTKLAGKLRSIDLTRIKYANICSLLHAQKALRMS